jgi:hypothetical protein
MTSTIKILIQLQEQFIDQSAQMLADFESGTRRLGERDGRRVDVTDEWVADIKERKAQAETILAALKKRGSKELD